MKKKEENFTGFKASGVLMLLIVPIVLIAIVYGIYNIAISEVISEGLMVGLIIFLVLVFFAFAVLSIIGFVIIEPNEAVVMVFFGKYNGTIKQNGFFWVNPFYVKKKLTLRARNLDADPIKVNDKTGNPIMIGVVVVWRIADTYKASFNIDNSSMAVGAPAAGAVMKMNEKMRAYENFVKIQSDSALRHVAGMFAYDASNALSDKELTLRSSADEINQILENQMSERLGIAGIEIVEARISYLAYSPEIAAVMLRRQQADAIIAAREKIVEGAVGMVELALNQLSEKHIIELDDDKKAAMVSNLMVVLCSEESTSPVINAGTLHQ